MKADKASKRPWKVYKHTVYMWNESAHSVIQVADAEDSGVLRIEGPKELCEANARAILDGVNGRDELVALVRRFRGIVNNLPPFVTSRALLDAEEPGWRGLTEAERAAKVSDGHKRLSALMVTAYDATGEDEA